MAVKIADARASLDRIGADRFYHGVLDRFIETYPDAGEVEFVRAPGRVNIIGEHTDYNGLPVMPMALDREIVIAMTPGEPGVVELANVDASYPVLRFEATSDIPKYETGHWGNYAKAAAQAVCEWAEEFCPGRLPLAGVRGIVGGSIPPGSGLSSSSALVVAVACALAKDLPIGRSELADLLAHGERYVGTEGGGMDQAASLLNKRGSALKIDFQPLCTRQVKLPEGCVLVVANSMVVASKTGGARIAYNTRVAECKSGLAMLKHDARGSVDDAVLLRDYMAAVSDWRLGIDRLPDGPMSPAQIALYVGTNEEELINQCMTQRDGSITPPPDGGFEPKKRVRHVLTEADRVERAADAAEAGDAVLLGRLMDESHVSCSSDYEVSCPELDELVATLKGCGALGARLTGAGFGGCTVALIRARDAQAMIDGVWREYYQSYLSRRGIKTPTDRDAVIFACHPVEGAGVIAL